MAQPETNAAASSKDRPNSFDEALLRRVRARDRDAMEAFFDHYFDRVYDYLYRMFRDPADADDAVQETFLRISRNVEKLDPRRDPTGWVFRIATNAVRDHWRARRRGIRGMEAEVEPEWDSIPPDPAESAQDRLEREEDAELMQRALGGLSPSDREIVLLRDYKRLSNAIIAETLELRPDAVRQRHSRALRRLGELFALLHGGGVKPE